MTNRELVFRAFNNETVDRVPVGFWFHFLPEAETGDGLREPGLWAGNLEGHRRFIDAARPDLVKIMSDGFFHYPAAGPLEKPADLERLEALPPGHPWLARQAELVRAVTALVPDTPCFYNIFSPATSLRFLLGRARLLEWLTLHPEAVLGALTRMGQGLAALAESAVKAGGADGIYLSVQNPDLGRVTDEHYARLIRPSDLAVLTAANRAGGRNILHICGYDGVRNHLPAWADYPAQAFSWAVQVEKVSLGQGKALFGGRCVIGGFANVPGSLLETGTRAEIEAFTDDLLAEAGRTGVILGADCTIPASIDLQRLEWVRLKAGKR